jgi:UDP-glucose 4-epimerase
VLEDLSTGDGSNLPRDMEVIEADIADPGVVERISNLSLRVVHAAAQVSVAASMKDPALDLAVNVGGRRTYSPGRWR